MSSQTEKIEKAEALRKMRFDFYNILSGKSKYVAQKIVCKWTKYTDDDIKHVIDSNNVTFEEDEDYMISNDTYELLVSMDVIKYLCIEQPTKEGKKFRKLFNELQHSYVDELLDDLAMAI